jgi:8-oxo-dGTP pyrophosphatase MutT (NUDIX family)
MGISPYLKSLRDAVGSGLLVLPAVTGIIRDNEDRILLVHQRDTDSWSTPGGAVDPNESPADAVAREVWEETGLDVEPTQILGVYSGPSTFIVYPNGHRTMYVNTVFECKVRSGLLHLQSDETVNAGYVGSAELANYRVTRWAEDLLPKLYRRSAPGHFEPPSWRPPLGDRAV